MNVLKLSGSLLTTTLLFSAALRPAIAGPFDFKPAGTIFGSPTLTPAPKPTPTPAVKPEKTGGSEVAELGSHESWVDTDLLSKDPRALCSDVGLGENKTSNSTKVAVATSTRDYSRVQESKNASGGGGGSVLGIVSIKGSGGSQNSKDATQSQQTTYSLSQDHHSSTATVVVGKNCDAFVNAAAARDMNYEDNLTQRYGIKMNRRGQQVDNLLK